MGRKFGICPARASRRGRAGAWLLLAIAALGVALWSYLGSAGKLGDEALAPRVRAGIDTSSTSGSLSGGVDKSPAGTADDSGAPGVRSAREGASQFLGRGSLRGLLTTKDGSPPPLPYILHVGPSGSIEGREYAEPRRVEMHAAEFELKDLPLGGYDVWVIAPGMNSRRAPVLLTQHAQHPYIIIKVYATGFLDGYVVNEDGRPAQDLRVELAQMFGDGRRVTQTRTDGSYLIEDIRDGDYRLSFGPQDRPLLSPRDVQFSAPSMHFTKVVLPPTVDVQFRSTDILGNAVPDVSVRGFSLEGGRLETVTDGEGHAWCRNVPPGKYSLTSQHEDGRRAKNSFVISGEPNQEFWIAVK